LLDKVGGEKGAAAKELLGGDNKVDALKDLLGKKKKSADAAPAAPAEGEAAPAEKPKSVEEKAEKKIKDLLKF
jgi:hypothetical protein